MRRLALVLVLTGCAPGHKVDIPQPPPDPPSDCADDAREEDDDLVTVSVVGKPITGQRFVKVDGVSCPGDDDWIHGYRSSVGTAGVELTWNASEGDLRVELVESDGRPLAPDVNEASPGKLKVLRSRHEQDFYIRIRNRAGTRVSYSAAVRFTE